MLALVLGGGAGVWDEVLAVEHMIGHQWQEPIVCANDVGVHWPRAFHHWVTLHPEKMNQWILQRAQYGFPNGYLVWARARIPSPKQACRSIVPWPGGSSGLLAIQVAFEIGATRVILCGIPMTATPHFVESYEKHIVDPNKNWAHSDKHWKAWVREMPRLTGRVRSMSGRTQEVFGAPDRAWIHEKG